MGSIATITAIVNFLDDSVCPGLPSGEPLIYDPDDCRIDPIRDEDDYSDLWGIGPVSVVKGNTQHDECYLLLTIVAQAKRVVFKYLIVNKSGAVVAKGHT